MVEAIFELLFGFIGEFLLELVLEVLVELGFHGAAERVSGKARSRSFVGPAYTIFGVILGALSLIVFPKIEFANALLPILYFLVSPIFAGLSLTTVSYFINQGIRPVNWFEWDKFLFGILFAVGYSVSRVALG